MPIKFKQGSKRLAGQKLQQTPPQVQAVPVPPTITELEAKRDNYQNLLSTVEKQVVDLENKYVRSANPLGTAVTGYQGFLTGRAVPEQDMHIFSKSSGTSTAPQSGSRPTETAVAAVSKIVSQPTERSMQQLSP